MCWQNMRLFISPVTIESTTLIQGVRNLLMNKSLCEAHIPEPCCSGLRIHWKNQGRIVKTHLSSSYEFSWGSDWGQNSLLRHCVRTNVFFPACTCSSDMLSRYESLLVTRYVLSMDMNASAMSYVVSWGNSLPFGNICTESQILPPLWNSLHAQFSLIRSSLGMWACQSFAGVWMASGVNMSWSNMVVTIL